jgi:hypothetical protein
MADTIQHVGRARIENAAREMVRGGIQQATVNRTRRFDLEPVEAWVGAKDVLAASALPVRAITQGADVIFRRIP